MKMHTLIKERFWTQRFQALHCLFLSLFSKSPCLVLGHLSLDSLALKLLRVAQGDDGGGTVSLLLRFNEGLLKKSISPDVLFLLDVNQQHAMTIM
jgi:hypothetical protein